MYWNVLQWIFFPYFVGNKAKRRISKRVFQETKHAKFYEKQTFLTSWYTHVRVRMRGVRNIRFSENLTCFVFLKHPFWDSCFCLITDDLHIQQECSINLLGTNYVSTEFFSGPYFPAFGLNTERYEVSLSIQPECGKIRTRRKSVFTHISHMGLNRAMY